MELSFTDVYSCDSSEWEDGVSYCMVTYTYQKLSSLNIVLLY